MRGSGLAIAIVALLLPSSAAAVTLTNHVAQPHGITEAADSHVLMVRTVAPPDGDDDGCANAADSYVGPGCKPPPPPPPPAPLVTPAPTAEPAAVVTTTAPTGGAPLSAIAQCESGGNYATDTGNGFYGAYQFTQSTWESVGGSGNPADASPAEQDARAAQLYAESGSSPWPVCGQ